MNKIIVSLLAINTFLQFNLHFCPYFKNFIVRHKYVINYLYAYIYIGKQILTKFPFHKLNGSVFFLKVSPKKFLSDCISTKWGTVFTITIKYFVFSTLCFITFYVFSRMVFSVSKINIITWPNILIRRNLIPTFRIESSDKIKKKLKTKD